MLFRSCPDISALPDSSAAHFENVQTLILDALRYTRHPTHLSIDEALVMVARFQPRLAVLTNLHSDIDYRTIAARLPDGVMPAHDGLVLTVG